MALSPIFTKHGEQTQLDDLVIKAFEAQIQGRLILPSDAEYDEARGVWNGMIDKHPSLIVKCASTQDVVNAVNFARDNDILTSVRGGGHNVAGNAIAEGGLVIDLSEMKAVQVDPDKHRVWVQGGATWGDVDPKTQEYGLAAPGGVVSETGVAGLALGGGLGWVRRKYGMTCDNLVSAEVVLADGQVVTASDTENSDLLWGLRGGGGNFGIVTRFEFQLHPIGPEVYFTFVFHPMNNAKEGLRFYREYCANSPDEVSSFAILGFVPAMNEIPVEHHHKPALIFAAMYSDDPSDGEHLFAPLRKFDTPYADFSGVMPYVEAQQFFDEDYPAGEMHYYWKSLYINGLGDETIDTLLATFISNPSHHSTIDIWQLGGAMNRVNAEATAFGDRYAPFLVGIESNWEDASDDEANITWNRRVYDAMLPFSAGKEYLNFPGFYEDNERMVKNAFGKNYGQLVALKTVYDPNNFFSMNQNIKPE